MYKKFTYFVGAFLLTPFISSSIIASGEPDVTFGVAGIVTTSFGRRDYINTATLQSDNNIVVAGVTTTNGAIKLAIARYTTLGALDPSFNATGVQKTSLSTRTEGNSVAMQTDGKIVVGGFAYNDQTDFAIVRYNTDGSLDNTFNGSGFVITSIGMGATANSVAIQSDGNIVAGGTVVDGVPQFVLARYTTTGSLDATFGSAGIVTTRIGFNARMWQIALQSDGKIVVVGDFFDGVMTGFAIARYTSNGSLDTTFGSLGIMTTHIGSEAGATSLAIQADGSIVVAGYAIESDIKKFVVARYTSSGTLDETFGSEGIVITNIQNGAEAHAVAVQTVIATDYIVVGGSSVGDVAIQFALARYESDGTLDNTFGTNGVTTTTVGANDSTSQINSIVIQPVDNKIVAAGFSDNDFALARYLP